MPKRELLRLIASDLYQDENLHISLAKLFTILFWRPDNRKALVLVRLSQYFYANGRRGFASRMARILRRDFGCMIRPRIRIGPYLKMPHPIGIVIGDGVEIGADCTVYQQVTIGGARSGDWQEGRYPVVGDHVTLFAGAKLLGGITLGNGATVGANAVVTRDVPADHVAVGIPAVARPAKSA